MSALNIAEKIVLIVQAVGGGLQERCVTVRDTQKVRPLSTGPSSLCRNAYNCPKDRPWVVQTSFNTITLVIHSSVYFLN